MVVSPNSCGSLKRPITDNNKVPKKPAKKMVSKKTSFISKPQTSISSQDISQLSFATSAGQSLSIVTPSKISSREESEFFYFQMQLSDELEFVELEPCSSTLLQQKQKTAFANQRLLTNKTSKTFSNEILINYLFSTDNMTEYKNSY